MAVPAGSHYNINKFKKEGKRMEDEDKLKAVQNILNLVDLDRGSPGGKRRLVFKTDSVVDDILKILMLHKFTTEEMEIIFTLVRYRITGVFNFFETSDSGELSTGVIKNYAIGQDIVIDAIRNACK